MKAPAIYVLICTLDDGIRRVAQVLLAYEEGVRYVVSWQRSSVPTEAMEQAARELEAREDVVVTELSGAGLCRNRNHAMDVVASLQTNAMEDVVYVIADDDERLEPDAFRKIREFYVSHPCVDVVLWQMASLADGRPLKSYPSALMDYRDRPRSYYPSSVELTFRSRLRVLGLRFDERFGLGSEKLAAGEEEVFLTDVLRRGLRVWMNPSLLCRTSASTTGSQLLNPKVLRSKGAVYAYGHGRLWSFFRSCREAISLGLRQRHPIWPIFRNIWYGVNYIRK